MQEPFATPTFADVADKIGARRLEKSLAQLAREIETEVHNAEFIPRHADVRRDIKSLNFETRRFEIALSRVSTRLLDLPVGADQTLLRAREATRDISALCDKALSFIPVEPGRKRPPGKITCALVVIEAWDFVKGRAPSANNEHAQEACEVYWRACGGQPSANWQNTLKAARGVHNKWRQHIRNEIRGVQNSPLNIFNSGT